MLLLFRPRSWRGRVFSQERQAGPRGLSISLPGSPPVGEGCPPPQTGHWALLYGQQGARKVMNRGDAWIAPM